MKIRKLLDDAEFLVVLVVVVENNGNSTALDLFQGSLLFGMKNVPFCCCSIPKFCTDKSYIYILLGMGLLHVNVRRLLLRRRHILLALSVDLAVWHAHLKFLLI